MFMGQLRNNPSVENTDALEQQQGSEASELSSKQITRALKKIHTYVVGAVMAVSPLLGSCLETGGQNSANQTAEQGNVESANVADRTVNLWYDGKNWNFQGKYTQDFRLTVETDGKQVFDQQVAVNNGNFSVNGLAGETAHDITIKAYKPDGTELQSLEIPIEPTENSKGMIGNPHLHNPEYK